MKVLSRVAIHLAIMTARTYAFYSTEDAPDDHSELIIGQPDGGDHHIEDPAEDAFERPSKNADVSIDPVVPGSPHQPLLAMFPERTFGQ